MKTLIIFLALCGTADAQRYVRVQVGAAFYNQSYGYNFNRHYHGPQYAMPFMLPYFVPPDPIYVPPPREGSYLDRQAKARAARQEAPASRVSTPPQPTVSTANPYDAFMRQAREAFLGGDYPAAMTAARHAQLENDTPAVQALIAAIQGVGR